MTKVQLENLLRDVEVASWLIAETLSRADHDLPKGRGDLASARHALYTVRERLKKALRQAR